MENTLPTTNPNDTQGVVAAPETVDANATAEVKPEENTDKVDTPAVTKEKIDALVDAPIKVDSEPAVEPTPEDTKKEVVQPLVKQNQNASKQAVKEALKKPEVTPPVDDKTNEEFAVFDKKSIDTIIKNYMNLELQDDEKDTAHTIFNTEENKQARALVRFLGELAEASDDDFAKNIISHLSLFASENKQEKDAGLFMQLLAQDFNLAKDIEQIDMAIFILTRIFRYVRTFSFNQFLKGIADGYHPEFKVHALQFVEVFKELVTKEDRTKKIGTTISFAGNRDGRGKAFGVSNVFLNQNGSKLLTEYFTTK